MSEEMPEEMPGDDPGAAWDEPDAPDEQRWPADRFNAEEVKRWIASVLPGRPDVWGPTETHQAKEWGVTARFVAYGGGAAAQAARGGKASQQVIFKANALAIFAAAPLIGESLTRHCPTLTPRQLAWQARGQSATWSLFEAFEGTVVEAQPRGKRRAELLAIAQTLAQIQAAVAQAPDAEKARLPRLELTRLPEWFERVAHDLAQRQAPYWRGKGQALARRFQLTDATLARFVAGRERAQRWSDELLAGPWPLTLDHVDLSWGNAARVTDGRMLIFDWEEATLSLPFFSLDRLLNDARELDLGERGAWRAPASDATLYTPTEEAVRDAYLAALPWGAPAQRARAFTLAMRLGPIKTAYEGMIFAEALGWPEGAPFVTAWALARMFPRWDALDTSDAQSNG